MSNAVYECTKCGNIASRGSIGFPFCKKCGGRLIESNKTQSTEAISVDSLFGGKKVTVSSSRVNIKASKN